MEALQIDVSNFFPILAPAPVQRAIQKKIYTITPSQTNFIPPLFYTEVKSYKLPLSLKKEYKELIAQYQIKEKPVVIKKNRTLAKLRLHPLKGALLCSKENLYYVKLQDSLIAPLFFDLKHLGLKIPSHFNSSEEIGAHIPVFLPEEVNRIMIDIQERGQSFYVFYTGIHSQTVSDSHGTHTIWYLSFKSPSLESLRQRYGLFGKFQGGDFYTLIGTKTVKKETSSPTFHINPLSISA